MLYPWKNDWWTRPCGGRDVLRLALPLVASMASWTVMTFTDRMFLLWYSRPAMAAALPSGMLHYTLLCFPLGVASYANTFVAQYHGAGRPERIGRIVWQGVLIGLFCTPLFLATIPLAPWLFRIVGHAPELARLETTYYQVMAFGAGGTIISGAMSSFFTGRGRTRVVMSVDAAIALLNGVLDYLLIFGRLGLPRLGIAGAALATTIATWVGVALYAAVILRPAHRRAFRLAENLRFDRRLMLRLLRFGGPNGLQLVLDVAAFAAFLLLVGRLGELPMAATTLAFNVNALVFIPMLGLGLAVSTMVGHELGRQRPDLAARATWTSFWIAAAYTASFGVMYVLAPDVFLIGHAAGTPPAEFVQLRNLVVVLLRFVAVYCLFDALNMIFSAAIKGAGDTRFVMQTAIAASLATVGVTYAGLRFLGFGLLACWAVVSAWACLLGMTYLARFLHGAWRTMRVIEPEDDWKETVVVPEA